MVAGAVYSHDRRGNGDELEVNMWETATVAPKKKVINLAAGHPPRSGIEYRLKRALNDRAHQGTTISWASGRIGNRVRRLPNVDVRVTSGVPIDPVWGLTCTYVMSFF